MQVESKASNPAARFAKELLSTVLTTVAFGLLWCVNIGLQMMFLLTNSLKSICNCSIYLFHSSYVGLSLFLQVVVFFNVIIVYTFL